MHQYVPKSFKLLISNKWNQSFLTPMSRKSASDRHSLEWPMVIFLVGIPLMASISLFWIPVYKKTVLFMCFYGFLRGICITAGYHRLWAHKSYSASSTLKLLFATIGAGAGEGTVKQWCRDHRAHHRYVDTDHDPYNVQRGFFYAHIGWILFKKSPNTQGTIMTGRVDISDIKSDPIVEWQRQRYWQLLVPMAYVFPTLISGLCWDDYVGGFIIAGCIGTFLVQQSTFCINSVAHLMGSQPFQSTKSPRDNVLAAIITLGEGYHNFHHEFPIDYRNGIRWYDYDPTKWMIWLCARIGLASNLRRFPYNEIEKGRLQQRRERLEMDCQLVDWGLPVAALPTMELEEYRQRARTGCNLVVIKGIVHDVSDFVAEHPGGLMMITGAIGKDATDMFEGGLYSHSNAAKNLLDAMRIAAIAGETWKA